MERNVLTKRFTFSRYADAMAIVRETWGRVFFKRKHCKMWINKLHLCCCITVILIVVLIVIFSFCFFFQLMRTMIYSASIRLLQTKGKQQQQTLSPRIHWARLLLNAINKKKKWIWRISIHYHLMRLKKASGKRKWTRTCSSEVVKLFPTEPQQESHGLKEHSPTPWFRALVTR